MKMVSQLTRQAMNRHRLASINLSSAPLLSIPSLAPQPPQPIQSPVDGIDAPASAFPDVRQQQPAPVPSPHPRTIYQQLMANHDRMRERHIRT